MDVAQIFRPYFCRTNFNDLTARRIFVDLSGMNRCFLILSLLISMMSSIAADSKVYEMRIYYAAEGKLDDLNARFRNHTLKLFEKHGIENVGYWVPIDNKEN